MVGRNRALMRIESGLVGLAAVVAMTACSTMAVGSSPSDSPASSAPIPHGSIVDDLTPLHGASVQWLGPPTKAVIVSQAAASGLLSMPWVLVSLSADHRLAEIVAVGGNGGNGGCVSPAGVRIERRSGAVTLTALSRQGPDQACTAMLALQHLTVELPVAVGGGVRLIHPPTDPDWSNPAFLAGFT
ncbi:hypothetical protein [Leifsonia sp. NPDC058248]|uniref:hypothetical protein n=1 Tax=Leifsonia sp. NPDC058248 TaxID=3346402 RepID=UPI0036DD80C1